MNNTQVCVECHRELPLSDFYRRKGRTRPYRFCRQCQSARTRAYRRAKPDVGAADRARRARARDPERFAEKDRLRAQSDLFKEKRRRRAVEQSTYYKKWYAINREHVLALHRAYRADPTMLATLNARKQAWYAAHPENRRRERHRRAARLRSAAAVPFTGDLLNERMSLWSGCWICGEPFTAHRIRTVDHVKPLSKGGPDMLANLRPACKSCNSRKGDRWPFPHQSAGLRGPVSSMPR
ncbi:HNH endonuclease signature motif containing protein [Tsukamurella tyrosinosolvens]|uniref:HNH endonuclease signature motif containing protein n=2 Tax=Tsukamurella tyrosinosolvens TaxID=57704 RepID=UPI0015F18242|nr:HNH endonuclease signature motif containing protein [Tsukamurella tyrosinosolvens]